jgi:hypothetical protein
MQKEVINKQHWQGERAGKHSHTEQRYSLIGGKIIGVCCFTLLLLFGFCWLLLRSLLPMRGILPLQLIRIEPGSRKKYDRTTSSSFSLLGIFISHALPRALEHREQSARDPSRDLLSPLAAALIYCIARDA